MRVHEVIRDATFLTVRDLVAMTGIPPSIWTKAVADSLLGRPYLKSGTWQIRAKDAVRFLKATEREVPDALAGVDRTVLVYFSDVQPDPVAATFARLSKVVEFHPASTTVGMAWLCGRYLPSVVVIPLSSASPGLVSTICEFSPETAFVLIGPAPQDSLAAQAKQHMAGCNVLFLDAPEFGPIAQLLNLPAEYMEALS